MVELHEIEVHSKELNSKKQKKKPKKVIGRRKQEVLCCVDDDSDLRWLHVDEVIEEVIKNYDLESTPEDEPVPVIKDIPAWLSEGLDSISNDEMTEKF